MTTTNPRDMDDGQRKALKQIEKLLRMAGGTENAEEAAAFAAKAQDMLLAYNLDASAVGGAEDGQRAQEKLRGGFYDYERDLWSRVADVNFCLHWVSRDWIDRPENEQAHAKVQRMQSRWRRQHILVHRHHLVGRRISVETTKFTMSYILEAIERLTREFVSAGLPRSAEDRVVGLGAALRSRRAVSFREGVAENISNRLWQRRQDQVAKERQEENAREALRKAAMTGEASSATALTISSVRQTERDANMDVLHGEGWSARRRAELAAQAAAARAAEEAYTRWAAAHPEEAAAQEKQRRAEERKSSRRRGGGPGSRGGSSGKQIDYGAYSAGSAAGDAVGLDPQTTRASAPRMIGRASA